MGLKQGAKRQHHGGHPGGHGSSSRGGEEQGGPSVAARACRAASPRTLSVEPVPTRRKLRNLETRVPGKEWHRWGHRTQSSVPRPGHGPPLPTSPMPHSPALHGRCPTEMHHPCLSCCILPVPLLDLDTLSNYFPPAATFNALTAHQS